ncbi:hypothetical protein Dimus_001369, partial [Dionaea muscipula]
RRAGVKHISDTASSDSVLTQRQDKEPSRVDPSGPVRRKLNLRNSSEFERKEANRFHDDLEKAKQRMPDF